MAWNVTLLLKDEQLTDPQFPWRNVSTPPEQIPLGLKRSLLVHITGTAYLNHPTAYTELRASPVWFDTPSGRIWMDPGTSSFTDLTAQEKQVLRTWLIERSRAAWLRASPAVKHMLGDDSPKL